ncbi:PAS domain S-box protein [Longimicrobium terrae]|uniref:histidine kinase n=1 Tax=Longimicrobium terrae TaxID=1639882 RepID=A0A841H7L6_9BACT|nr:PAS domain S-box protein [Longimicrobium terrae]MBB4639520.1 PAS domain S-box-containing protein [Longimicrobium terrae]MBB6073892.1 PAS domain S-box-containing protein [Longimicrobium terrae]NNC32490.1 PAS domain S-box protein [Longimicrobium terrae]
MNPTHSVPLVLLSLAIAIVASYAALVLAGRVTASRGSAHQRWLVAGGIALGTGIWSMNFVGLLALRLPVPIGHDVPDSVFALMVAIAASLVALHTATGPTLPGRRFGIAGLVMGAGFTGMLFLNLSGMDGPVVVHFEPERVLLSGLVITVVSLCGLWVAFHLRDPEDRRPEWQRGAASVVLGCAVALAHHTGTFAARFGAVGAALPVPRDFVPGNTALTTAVALAAGTLLLLAVYGARIDLRARTHAAVVLERITDGFLAFDPGGTCTYANRAAEELLGRPRQAMLGRRLHDIIPGAENSALEQACRRAMAEQATANVEEFNDALQLWLEVHVYPSDDGLSVYVRDVTSRRKAGDALRRREQQLADAQRIAQLGSWESGGPGTPITWSREAYRIFGQDPETFVLTRESYMACVHPDDRERIQAEFARAAATGEEFGFEKRIVRPDGEVRVIFAHGTAAVDPTGGPPRFTGTVQDITDRKAAEQRLREADRMLDAVIQSSPLAVMAVDTAGAVTLWNPAAERVFGWKADEVLGQPVPVIPEEQGELLRTLLAQGPAAPGIRLRELQRRHRDGRMVDVSLSAAPLMNPGGEVAGAVAIVADNTAQRAASEALRNSEERFRELAENIREVFWIKGPGDGPVLYVSPAAEQVWNMSPDTLMGDPDRFLAKVHPDDRGTVLRARTAVQADATEFEYRIVRPDGEVRWVRDRGFPVRDAAGAVVRVVGVAEDITARRAADQALRAGERQAHKMAERMRAVAAAAGATIGAQSREALRDVLAEAVRRVIPSDTFTFATLLPDEWALWYLGDYDAGVYGGSRPVPLAGTPGEGVIRGRRPLLIRRSSEAAARGGILWGTGVRSESSIRVPILSGGDVLGMITVQSYTPELYDEQDVEVLEALAALAATALRNIRLREEQNAAQEALRRSEADYRGLFENAHDAILIIDPDGERVLDVNPRACELYGYPREQFVGMAMEAVSVDAEMGRARVLEALKPGVPRHFELVQRVAGGAELHVEVIATAVPYRGGRAILSINRDITERRQAEDALRASELKFRSVTHSAADAIVTIDSEGCIVSWNRGAETVFGYCEAEALGQALEIMMPERFRERHRAGVQRMAHTGDLSLQDTTLELVGMRRDGTEFPLEASLALWDVGGRRFATRIMRDVSERRRSEEALRRSQQKLAQAQKMEAVGRLAGGVAHDFNNLLTVIGGNADLLILDRGGDDDLCEQLGEIKQAADRAAALTRQLLAFSRQQVLQPRLLDLDAVVSGMHKMLSRLIAEHVDVVLRLHGSLPPVKADPTQMEQVILNLAVNARDAMPDGGRLLIRTDAVRLEQPELRAGFELPAGPYVVLSVTDTGHGIEPAALGRIFEPFFTTKAEGHGTGLGLATVYGIVQQSGGWIDVASEPDRGTRFEVFLPSVAAEVDAPEAGAGAGTHAARGSGTVLLVEDNAAVRLVGSRALTRSGYTVLDAGDGEEGLKVAAAYDGRIDLVVTDVVMPRMGGRELARRLSESRPETRVIFTSGFTEDSVLRPETFEPGAHFLPKPYGPAELVRHAMDVLAEV